MASTSFYTLFESSSGFALFNVLESEEIASMVADVQNGTTDFSRFQRVVRLLAFQPFISAEDALASGYSGPNLRAAGVDHDVRKDTPYMLYDKVDFDVPIGEDGSVLHRALVRAEEMYQSIRIIEQLVDNIPSGNYHADLPHIFLPEKQKVYTSMEELIYHFKIIMHGVKVPAGEQYFATEAANGELGFYIVSEGEKSPWRVHVRRPCFWFYQSFPDLVKGGLLADSIATMSSLNVIAGELDC